MPSVGNPDMADAPDQENGPMPEVEEWGVVLVGMQLRFVRLLLELLIEKRLLSRLKYRRFSTVMPRE